jgi:hypothetical protein
VKKQTEEHQRAISGSSNRPSLSPETSSRPSKRARVINESSQSHQVAAPSASGGVGPAGRVTRSGSQRATATAKTEGDSIVIDSESDEDGAYRPESSGSFQVMPSQQSRENGKDYRSMQGEQSEKRIESCTCSKRFFSQPMMKLHAQSALVKQRCR